MAQALKPQRRPAPSDHAFSNKATPTKSPQRVLPAYWDQIFKWQRLWEMHNSNHNSLLLKLWGWGRSAFSPQPMTYLTYYSQHGTQYWNITARWGDGRLSQWAELLEEQTTATANQWRQGPCPVNSKNEICRPQTMSFRDFIIFKGERGQRSQNSRTMERVVRNRIPPSC